MEQDGFDKQVDEELSNRPSWAAYFGAASGLILGVILGVLGASLVDLFFPATSYALMFWEITGPLFAIVGFIVVAMAFHRWFRGQIATPAMIFFVIFFLGAYLVYGPLGLEWLNG